MNDLLVIGAGQIGSRHLQALAQLDGTAYRVHAMDPSPASLATAKARIQEVAGDTTPAFEFHEQLDTTPAQFEVAIIATAAQHRLSALRALLTNHRCTYLVLEKVLFQKLDEYQTAQDLIERAQVPTWVNCARRMMPCFRDLLPLLQGAGPIAMTVSGRNWGLGCNAIHFIDLLAMYTGTNRYDLNHAALDPILHPSKRADNVELTGTLRGTMDNQAGTFAMTCTIDDGPVEYSTVLQSERARVELHSGAQEAVITHTRGGAAETERRAFVLPFQSQLSQHIVQQLNQRGDCDLTPYGDSRQLHVDLIEPLLTFARGVGQPDLDRLPIT